MMLKKAIGCLLLILLLFAGCVEMPEPTEPKPPAKPKNAQLTVEADPAGARLFLEQESRSLTAGQTFELAPGPYDITVSDPGYIQKRVHIYLAPGEARNMKIKLVTATGRLRVVTEPSRAKISLNGEDKGSSPLLLKLIKGEYVVKAEKKNYIAETQEMTLAGEGKVQTVFLKLSPQQVALKVRTSPGEAEVRLNGKLLGKTPLETAIDPGQYELAVKLKGYHAKKHKFMLEPGDAPLDLQYLLEPIMGSISVNSSPAKAQVYINDQPKGQTPLKLPLNLGSYQVRITQRDYFSVNREVVLDEAKPDHTIDETLKLKEGTITVNTKPSEAEVLINGESKGKTPLTAKLPMGGYQLEIKKPDFVNINTDVRLSESRPEVTIDQPLQLIRGSLTVNTQPSGVNITLNEEPKGQTPQTFELPMGLYKIKLSKFNYTSIEREVSLNQADPDQSLTENMELAMGSITVGSPQSNVVVAVNGEAMGQTPLTLALPMGRYMVRFSRQDYVSVVREVVLSETNPEQKLNVLLKLARGSLKINSQPVGAQVRINGRTRGETPLEVELPMGEYEVQLKKDDYMAVTRTVSLSEANPVRHLDEILPLVLGSIRVASQTPEVDVIINGKPKGKTPLSLTLPMGSYQLELTKPKHVPVKVTVSLTEENPHQILMQNLLLAQGSVTFTTDPSGAEVFINGKPRGNTPLVLDLPMGRHRIKFDKDRYVKVQRSVTLTQSEPEQGIHQDLELIHGTILATSPIPDVEVSVNGKARGKTPLTLKLPLGTYKIGFRKYGYDSQEQEVVLSSGRFKQKVAADLNRLPGELAVEAKPDGVKVFVNGQAKGTAPLRLTLPVGEYKVAFKRDQFISQEKTVSITDPKPKKLSVALKCACGPVTLEAEDPNASIIFAGRIIGKGQAYIRTLKFGRYSAVAYLPTGKLTRKVGAVAFELNNHNQKVVRIPLDRNQRRYEGKWVDEKSAVNDELSQYRVNRINKALSVEVKLSPKSAALFRAMPNLGRNLFDVMRIGDRVVFQEGGENWTLWKRGSMMTEEYELAVNSFIQNQHYAYPWPADRALEVIGSDSGFADLAMDLHRGRVVHPMVDLELSQLPAQGLTLYTSPNDRMVYLLIKGGQGVKLMGKSPEVRQGLIYLPIEAGWNELELSWTQRPQRLLMVCDGGSELSKLEPRSIATKQIQIVTLSNKLQTVLLERFTKRMGEDKWIKTIRQAQEGASTEDNLNVDELGPHDQSGTYERVWVLRYKDAAGFSQRQISTTYMVTSPKTSGGGYSGSSSEPADSSH